jgi:hypothetical protein
MQILLQAGTILVEHLFVEKNNISVSHLLKEHSWLYLSSERKKAMEGRPLLLFNTPCNALLGASACLDAALPIHAAPPVTLAPRVPRATLAPVGNAQSPSSAVFLQRKGATPQAQHPFARHGLLQRGGRSPWALQLPTCCTLTHTAVNLRAGIELC